MRFDRNEWSGSFGDIGTDFPLMVGVIAASGLKAGVVFAVFGALQILSGIYYRLPMPLQPLKAMAVIIISAKLAPPIIAGGALAIAAMMIVLTVTGMLGYLAKLIPVCVIRGIQLGLGLSLVSLALQKYVPAQGTTGYFIAGGAFLVLLLLRQNRKIPAGLILVCFGLIWALFNISGPALLRPDGYGGELTISVPDTEHILAGLFLLALPQLPLSLANSVFATRQTCTDFFPEARVTVQKIGYTYTLGNIVAGLFGGLPVCHGCGGLAGHYALGARTGGSVVIYGAFFLLAGLLFGSTAHKIVGAFPLALLGAILVFEATTLMQLSRDLLGKRRELLLAALVALIAFIAPYGYALGLTIGTLLYYLSVAIAKKTCA